MLDICSGDGERKVKILEKAPAIWNMRKGMCKSQCQIKLSYGFVCCFCLKGLCGIIILQVFTRVSLKNMKHVITKLLEHGICSYDHRQPIFEGC